MTTATQLNQQRRQPALRSRLGRQRLDRAFVVFCVAVSASAVLVLGYLLWEIFFKGISGLSWRFLTSLPHSNPQLAGIWHALVGTALVGAVCAFFALPTGVATAIFLEEFRPRRQVLRTLHGFVQLNITNLAGVPSVVYGILGVTAFVSLFGRSVLAGALTLTLVILPIVITATQEALRAVPNSLREAALGMGCTRWQMVRRVTLPAATPGIMTGSILAMSRAVGEAAPIMLIAGGVVYLSRAPHGLMSRFTVMPLQVYNWAQRPQAAFQELAAAGIIVLLIVLLLFNIVAIVIRQVFQKPLS
jgi:phosphate transport system permease protein